MATNKNDGVVVDFRSATPEMRFKERVPNDGKRYCKHKSIEVWPDEPMISCVTCGAIVDAYTWIRERCSDWASLHEAEKNKILDAKTEVEELKTAIRRLRGEYKDEAEKRQSERDLMVMPPRRRV